MTLTAVMTVGGGRYSRGFHARGGATMLLTPQCVFDLAGIRLLSAGA
jgi:hypothetical protein